MDNECPATQHACMMEAAPNATVNGHACLPLLTPASAAVAEAAAAVVAATAISKAAAPLLLSLLLHLCPLRILRLVRGHFVVAREEVVVVAHLVVVVVACHRLHSSSLNSLLSRQLTGRA